MWTHPGPGIKPISPELAGRFFNTGPLGKSSLVLLRWSDILKIWTYSPIPKFCLIQKLLPPVLLRLVCFCITGQSVQLSSVQSLSRVQLSVTPWTVACQASLSITNSWSLLKLMSIESVMSFNHLILCRPTFLPVLNLSQHQDLFKWVSSSHQVAKLMEFQLQHQSFQWIFRTDLL